LTCRQGRAIFDLVLQPKSAPKTDKLVKKDAQRITPMGKPAILCVNVIQCKLNSLLIVCFAFLLAIFDVQGFNKDSVELSGVGIYETDFLPPSFHKEKRETLRSLMPDNSVAVLFSSPIKNRSNDVDYAFHQDPSFYYLTGLKEPHALLLVFKEVQEINGTYSNEVLYLQPHDEKEERWNGKRMGVQGAVELLGFSTGYANFKFAVHDFNFPSFDKVLYVDDPSLIMDNNNDRGDLYSLNKHFFLKQDSNLTNLDSRLLKEIMASIREIKSEVEIGLLQKAIDITCKAQIELMQTLEPGMTEYQSEALIEYVFKNEGAEHPGFPSIVGGGENSCILHYTNNRKTLEDGDLIVVDVGAEYHSYTADVTRTIPVNGTFSEEQRIIYDIVLKAQTEGIRACVPGNKFWAANEKAIEIIADGLLGNGIIAKREEYRNYFMHGTSHYLGLDVHDVGLYGSLKPGNVLTVEPGIYIPIGANCDEKWWNIGIRIEDDILITPTGYNVLSGCVPKSVAEIEQLMSKDNTHR